MMPAIKATVTTIIIVAVFVLVSWAIFTWPVLILVIGGSLVVGYLWMSLYRDFKKEERLKR